MHHTPLASGVPAWDGINLTAAERTALGEVAAGHPQLGRSSAVTCTRRWGAALGRPSVLAAPSTYLPTRRGSASTRCRPSTRPGRFALHVLRDGRPPSHLRSLSGT